MPKPPQLTRRQQEIHHYLVQHFRASDHAPTLDELCLALGLSSRGSLHKQIQALIDAGLVQPMDGKQRGVRLTATVIEQEQGLPFVGYIAAGRPIEALENPEYLPVPDWLRSDKPCFMLRVKGDSMIEEGILDGDWVVVESRSYARNGDIVVAVVDNSEATLKRIEQHPDVIILHPAHPTMQPLRFAPQRVTIQGVLVAQMRRYR